MSKNISISSKIKLYWDHFEKVVFRPYIRKYEHFEKKGVVWHHLYKSFFAHITKNINISRKKIYLEITLDKNQKYQHFEENCVMLRSLWKSYFLPIPPKISNLKERVLFANLFQKIIFCSYVQKYQHFEEKYIVLRSLWKFFFSVYIRKYQHF